MDEDKNWHEFVRFAREMRAAKRYPTWSQIPLERQSKRGEVPHLHLEHPHPEVRFHPRLEFAQAFPRERVRVFPPDRSRQMSATAWR